MTCREKLAMEHPEELDSECFGGCNGCPSTYGYAKEPEWCDDNNLTDEKCRRCWDREVETDMEGTIKDGGDRTEAETVEVRYKELLQEAQLLAEDIVVAVVRVSESICG